MKIDQRTRILVTGASGMVGGAILKTLQDRGHRNLLSPARAELDLRNEQSVRTYFRREQPQVLFLCAAKVGGIAANMRDPVGFLSENLRIALNALEIAAETKIAKVVFLGSSCIYPRESPQPMREEYLLAGPLEPTNEGYALAKIGGLRLAQYLWRQGALKTISPMPCNIYGPGDHFDLEKSHVLSALVRRFVDASETGAPSVTLWGTGRARREFIHVNDVVDALLFLLEHYDSPEIINVGTGVDVSIAELAHLVAKATGYGGEILWDPSKPDGMPRKCLDVSRLNGLGFSPKVNLEQGIQRTVQEYRQIRIKA